MGGSPTKKLDYVDVFKINKYIMENTFKVEKLDAVNREIAELTQEQQDLLKSEYELIEIKGIEYVRVKHLQNKNHCHWRSLCQEKPKDTEG